MADIRKTVGDLDTWGTFDGTEVMEVFPESEGKSYKKKVGTATDRDVGTGNDDLPDTSQLNVRLGTTGNLGTAAIADIGVGPSEIRINSNAMPSRTESGNYTAQTGDYIINCTASNAEITIPDDFPIGYRLLIRKLSAYDTTNTDKIDIVFSGGEVCTPEQLASIEIYGNGGNWLIEKVTATRWEIVGGWDGGENANGEWELHANGSLRYRKEANFSLTSSSAINVAYTSSGWPIYRHIVSTSVVHAVGSQLGETLPKISQARMGNASATMVFILSTAITGDFTLFFTVLGRWYALS